MVDVVDLSSAGLLQRPEVRGAEAECEYVCRVGWIGFNLIIGASEGGSEDLYGGRTSKLEHKGLTH